MGWRIPPEYRDPLVVVLSVVGILIGLYLGVHLLPTLQWLVTQLR